MKIILRKMGIRDFLNLAKAIKNPEVGDRLQYTVPGYLLKGLEEILKRKNTYKFAILADGKFAGGIVLEKPNKDKTSYEVGYFVARNYWNKGVASEAVKKIVRLAFEKLNIKKVWAETDIDNPASGKVLKKAGFKLKKRDKKKKELKWEKEK